MGSKDEQYEIELEQTPPFEQLTELRRQQEGQPVGEQDHLNASPQQKGKSIGEPSFADGEYEIEPVEAGERGAGEPDPAIQGESGHLIQGIDDEEIQLQMQQMQDGQHHNGVGSKLSIDEENLQEYILSEHKHRPYFVVLVIVICVIMFLVSMAKNDWKVAPLNENPMVGPHSLVLIQLGAKVTELIVIGDWWRLITPMFLHAGLIHLLLNMITLWRLGSDLEETFGPIRIGAIYFLSGLFGILMSSIFLPEVPGVGASGAICGLLGAKLGDFFHYHKWIQEGKWKYLVSLVLSTVISLAMGLLPLLDNFGHLGGWICGLLSGTVFLAYAVKDPHSGRQHWRSFAVLLCLAILILFFIVAFAVLYSSVDGNTWCSWCNNFSCIRGIPWWDCSKQYCRPVTRHYTNGTTTYECEPV